MPSRVGCLEVEVEGVQRLGIVASVWRHPYFPWQGPSRPGVRNACQPPDDQSAGPHPASSQARVPGRQAGPLPGPHTLSALFGRSQGISLRFSSLPGSGTPLAEEAFEKLLLV